MLSLGIKPMITSFYANKSDDSWMVVPYLSVTTSYVVTT